MGSIAEKLSYLNGTKRLLRRRLNSLGANITLETRFRDYLLWLDRFFNAASSSVEFEILGETKQYAVNSSANILPLYDDEIVTDGVTVTVSDGGKVTINGTTERELWIKITNGMEVEYTSPSPNRGHRWYSEKINEFDTSTYIRFQSAIGGGTGASVGNYIILGYHDAEDNSEGTSIQGINTFVDNTMPEKSTKASNDLPHTSETNFVCLHLKSGESFNTYGYIQIVYQYESNWVPNNDALPASPDNEKYFRVLDDITYTASDGTEFPIWLTYPDAPYNFVLGSIGDYKDRIYYKNGKFYCERNTSGYLFDGSEDDFYALNGVYYTNGNYMNFKNNSSIVSNYYVYGGGATNTSSAYNNGNNKISLNYSDGKSFYLRNDSLNTKSAWATWLSTHNVVVYYVPNEPLITEITEQNAKTLYDQLKAIIDHEAKLEIEKKIF